MPNITDKELKTLLNNLGISNEQIDKIINLLNNKYNSRKLRNNDRQIIVNKFYERLNSRYSENNGETHFNQTYMSTEFTHILQEFIRSID